MQYKKLGRTGLKVSRICLGTMVYGDQIDETESIKLINDSIDAGINFLDTADIYTGGRSEEIVGKALKAKRESVVLSTKVGAPTGPGLNDTGLSRKHIMKRLEDSLRRLRMDYIDVYYAHAPDFNTPLEDTLRTFDDLISQGKVRYIGICNISAWLLCKALWTSDVHNLARFDCIQTPYNLLTRDIETEQLPLCANEGIGVCVYNPLAGELLTGRHKFGKPPAEGRFTHPSLGRLYLERYWSETNFQAVAYFEELAKRHGCTLPQFALAWILNSETITSVLSGPTTPEQLKENLVATEIVLSQEELEGCDKMWQMFRLPRYPYAKELQGEFTDKMSSIVGQK
jgi:aryl-alcohol dehydrogenase-like predicted oxidoreductase